MLYLGTSPLATSFDHRHGNVLTALLQHLRLAHLLHLLNTQLHLRLRQGDFQAPQIPQEPDEPGNPTSHLRDSYYCHRHRPILRR